MYEMFGAANCGLYFGGSVCVIGKNQFRSTVIICKSFILPMQWSFGFVVFFPLVGIFIGGHLTFRVIVTRSCFAYETEAAALI